MLGDLSEIIQRERNSEGTKTTGFLAVILMFFILNKEKLKSAA
jgi:hypothetical protein